MTKPISVVHVIDHMGAGGAQQLVANLAIRQLQNGVSVNVIALRGPTPLGARLSASGVPVYFLGLTSWDPRQVALIRRILRTINPSIVHLHLIRACTFGWIAAALAGVSAIVIHDHEASAEIYTHPGPLLALRRLIEPHVTSPHVIYIAVSETAAAYAVQAGRRPVERVKVVYDGIDWEFFANFPLNQAEARASLGLPEGKVLIVGVGRLRPVKGFDILLEAVAALPANIHLALAGDGPERSVLAMRATQLEIADRVHFLGHLTDVRSLLRAGDIYVQPSRREAFGLAAVEAGAIGLPVVASAVGGLREIVCHGETGLLVPPERPTELAAALGQLVVDPSLSHRLGLAARDRVRARFTIEQTVERLDAIYRSLICC